MPERTKNIALTLAPYAAPLPKGAWARGYVFGYAGEGMDLRGKEYFPIRFWNEGREAGEAAKLHTTCEPPREGAR